MKTVKSKAFICVCNNCLIWRVSKRYLYSRLLDINLTCYSMWMSYRLLNGSPRYKVWDLSVVVGMHYRRRREQWKKRYSVRNFTAHQLYSQSPVPLFDVALILLRKRIRFNDKISPICVDNSTFPSNTACYTTGWGVIQNFNRCKYAYALLSVTVVVGFQLLVELFIVSEHCLCLYSLIQAVVSKRSRL